jgi:hypothetical protein
MKYRLCIGRVIMKIEWLLLFIRAKLVTKHQLMSHCKNLHPCGHHHYHLCFCHCHYFCCCHCNCYGHWVSSHCLSLPKPLLYKGPLREQGRVDLAHNSGRKRLHHDVLRVPFTCETLIHAFHQRMDQCKEWWTMIPIITSQIFSVGVYYDSFLTLVLLCRQCCLSFSPSIFRSLLFLHRHSFFSFENLAPLYVRRMHSR